jgi:hypothetical protein
MRKRLPIVGAVVPVAMAVAIVVYARDDPPDRPGLTPANLKQLQVGMHQREVEAILGPPLGDFCLDWARKEKGAPLYKQWENADGWMVNVYFDTGFRYVRWEEFYRPPTALGRLCKRFGL